MLSALGKQNAHCIAKEYFIIRRKNGFVYKKKIDKESISNNNPLLFYTPQWNKSKIQKKKTVSIKTLSI